MSEEMKDTFDFETPSPDPDAPENAEPNGLETRVIEVLHTIYDPEIPVDIYELGLIYNVAIHDGNKVAIVMTLTSPGCPVAGSMPKEVADKVRAIEGVTGADIDLVWEPPWTPDMMSEAARLELDVF